MLTVLGHATVAFGQNPSPSANPAQVNPDIVIVADPSQRSSIDRTTYVVRDNAQARSFSTLDLLAQVPSVEVRPDGQVRLLGKAGVAILIDGKEVPNVMTFLRNLQGSQVAKIEVISNPSAQFSARGTGGIINIITRRSFASGLGGSVTASAGSFGAYEANVSPTWSRGNLSLSLNLGHGRSVAATRSGRDRVSLEAGGEQGAGSIERSRLRRRTDTLTGNFVATYRLTPKQTLSFTARASADQGDTSQRTEILFDQASGRFGQTSSGRSSFGLSDLSAEYRRQGAPKEGTLILSASRSGGRIKDDQLFTTEGGSGQSSLFRLISNNSFELTALRLDYNRPFGKQRRLSAGAAFQHSNDVQLTGATGQLPFGEIVSFSSSIRGSWQEKAAYATYQFPLIKGTVLAGLRMEDRRYELAGNPAARQSGGTYFFPSLHLERPLAEWLVGNLSYSRRILWPSLQNLDPALRFSDPTTAVAGNPLLRPEITDSYELKLQSKLWAQTIDLTLYSRTTKGLFSSLSELDGNRVLVTRSVNFGQRSSRGISLSARGRLGAGFAYSVSGNLADQRIEQGPIHLDDVTSSPHSGSFQLDYRDGTDGRRGTDYLTIRMSYSGPINLGLYRISSYASANASWSHAFTDRVSGVFSISDIIGPPTIRSFYFSSDVLARQFSRSVGPRIKASLTYSLGAIRR